jgi:hypothetical protein
MDRRLLILAFAIAALAMPTAGTAETPPNTYPIGVCADSSAVALDEPTNATPADPAPAEPEPDFEQTAPSDAPPTAAAQTATSVEPLPALDPGIELRQVPLLVEFGWGGGLSLSYTTLTVSSSGNATVTVSGRTPRAGTSRSFTLSGSEVARLRSALEQARFGSLRSSYVLAHGEDAEGYRISYAGRTVSIYPAFRLDLLPRRLARVLKLLDRLLAEHPATETG